MYGYELYAEYAHVKSSIKGEQVPEFDDLPDVKQEIWIELADRLTIMGVEIDSED
jgi:hypothetical protein